MQNDDVFRAVDAAVREAIAIERKRCAEIVRKAIEALGDLPRVHSEEAFAKISLTEVLKFIELGV